MGNKPLIWGHPAHAAPLLVCQTPSHSWPAQTSMKTAGDFGSWIRAVSKMFGTLAQRSKHTFPLQGNTGSRQQHAHLRHAFSAWLCVLWENSASHLEPQILSTLNGLLFLLPGSSENTARGAWIPQTWILELPYKEKGKLGTSSFSLCLFFIHLAYTLWMMYKKAYELCKKPVTSPSCNTWKMTVHCSITTVRWLSEIFWITFFLTQDSWTTSGHHNVKCIRISYFVSSQLTEKCIVFSFLLFSPRKIEVL